MVGDRTIEDIKNRHEEYEGYMIAKNEVEIVKQLKHMEVRKDDVFVASFPKSGTTWLQEIVWLVCHEADTKSAEQSLRERFPYVELNLGNFTRMLTTRDQRFIKTHLPIDLLPKAIKEVKPKILYVARNPKDMLVSFYFFFKILKMTSYGGTLEELHRTLIEDDIICGPWWKHVLGYWFQREEENVIFLTYEEMTKDVATVVKRVALFLGKELTDKQISVIVEHTSFQKMKVNKATNYSLKDDLGTVKQDAETEFIRKGKVGDWRNHFTPEMSEAIERMVEERIHPHGLQFEDTLP